MPVSPTGHSSPIDSSSSFNSSKSSLLAPPADELSSQSDVADSLQVFMPRGDFAAYGVAASPDHTAPRASASTISASQKLKRAFAKRRRPSQDAGIVLSSGDERYTQSDFGPSASFSPQPPSSSVSHPPSSRPSAAKLTMHLFGGRKHHEPLQPDPNQPPPLPPKPTGLRGPFHTNQQTSGSDANKAPTNAFGARPRSSVMVTSPSITAAIQFMREDEERQRVVDEQRQTMTVEDDRELEESKENWRKSDSTMCSGHTVRPTNPSGGASKRLSAFMATPPGGRNTDLIEFLAGGPEPETPRAEARSADPSVGKHSKRRSMSLNVHVPSTHSPASAPSGASVPSFAPSPYPTPTSTTDLFTSTRSPDQSFSSLASSAQETPSITHTPASGTIPSGTPASKFRDRLAVWSTNATGTNHRSPSPIPTVAASTSSPSLITNSTTSDYSVPYRRMPVASDASQPSPDLQAMVAVRQLQNRVRSPSGSSASGPIGIRQAATSLTSGAGAMALGLGKRAYEKVGRVWGGSQSGSGSGSDTPSQRHPSPVNKYGAPGSVPPQASYNLGHGPSAFPPHGKRTPNAPSGTWSISTMGGSRSSSERDRASSGPETPSSTAGSSSSGGLGRLVRPPRSNSGGAVFGRELWECVKETKAAVPGSARDPLAGRKIPALVYRCAQHLHRWGIEEEGLFRISGRSSHINRLRNEFDGGADYDIIECSPSELDPHAVASVFKAYLRELPEPILTRALGHLFEAAINAENSRAAPAAPSGMISKSFVGGGLPSGPRAVHMLRKPPSLSTFTLPTSSSLRAPSSALIEALGDLIARLPRENRDLLQTVVELIKATAARSKETKMPLSNLLLVFCPSLSMPPTLLRVICDVSSIWEERAPLVDISRDSIVNDNEDSDDSISDSDSDSEYEGDLVVLPHRVDDEAEEPVEDPQSVSPISPSASEMPELEPPEGEGEGDLLQPPSRPPRAVRRVPVPALFIESQQTNSKDRLLSPPVRTDSLPASESTQSLDVPPRSRTPSSPGHSEASLNSSVEQVDHILVPRRPQLSSPPSIAPSTFVPPASWGVPDHDKALPAFPRSPPAAQQSLDDQPQQIGPDNSSEADNSNEANNRFRSESQLLLPKNTQMQPERSASLPATQHVASKSAPSVVFPTVKTAPSTPTSLKKHALTLSLGRSPKLVDNEDLPSPSKRMVRRPSLNMLLNLKRGGSPSPRSRTPTISSPLSSPASPGQALSNVDLSPQTATTPFPPVLSLPIVGAMDVGLGWDDVFGGSEEVSAPPQHRPTAISQPSAQPPWTEPPPSPSRRPTTEYLTSSSGFFGANGPPHVFPSATAVLEAANSGNASSDSSSSIVLQDGMSSGDDSPEVNSPTDETYTPPPHITFQLRRSSLEDEDWASAVLLAAGKPADTFA